MKIRTSELAGAALDWAVAKCEGVEYFGAAFQYLGKPYFTYSSNWSQGGPIIRRERINLRFHTRTDAASTAFMWAGHHPAFRMRGPTELIAAMRCYVASKLGEEVDIPEELYK